MSKRVRRHANPFNCTVELGRIDRMALFGREVPLEVELGPGTSSFLFDRARNNPDRDFVGIEVRKPMVEAAMERRAAEGPDNAVVFHANANVNLTDLCAPGVIARFHVHFPDPWPKKKHRKRRILQPAVARAMASLLPLGGDVYAQSDVKGLAEEMFDILRLESAFASKLGPDLEVPRPIPEVTDWERHHEKVGEPVYRMLFEKVAEPTGPVPQIDLRPIGKLGDNAAREDGQ